MYVQDPVLKNSWPSGHWPFFCSGCWMSSAISSAPFSKSPSFHLWWLGQSFIIPDLSVWGKQACRIRRDGWMEIEKRTLTPPYKFYCRWFDNLQMAVIRRYQRLLNTN